MHAVQAATAVSGLGLQESLAEAGAGTWLVLAGAAAGAYCLWEQLKFRIYRTRSDGKLLPGPGRVVPLVGGIIEMVRDPYAFWEQQRRYSDPGLSFNSLMGRLMVFVTDADLCRETMTINDPSKLLLNLAPAAGPVLGEENLTFLHGELHKALRRSFVSLFTRKALSMYVELQDAIIRRHIERWLAAPGEFEVREHIRDMNQETSQEVFIGPYLDNPAEREKFGVAYRNLTNAFMGFPVCLPGTAVWRGRQARFFIVDVLIRATARSKAYLQAGGQPRCLLDFWAQRCMEDIGEAEAAGLPRPEHTKDHRMADAMLAFLFASQDASTASLCWTLTLMADHPEVLEKVREEQVRVRGGGLRRTLDGAALAEMEYTRQVVKEILRYRAPAPMVIQMAQTRYPLTDTFSVPKGSIVALSVNASNMQGFTDPLKFDPDRFGLERKEDIKFARNFLTFGWGPHYCVGREYATNHLICFLAIVSMSCNWTRRRTPNSYKYQYLPTIYPRDSLITFHRRGSGGA